MVGELDYHSSKIEGSIPSQGTMKNNKNFILFKDYILFNLTKDEIFQNGFNDVKSYDFLKNNNEKNNIVKNNLYYNYIGNVENDIIIKKSIRKIK